MPRPGLAVVNLLVSCDHGVHGGLLHLPHPLQPLSLLSPLPRRNVLRVAVDISDILVVVVVVVRLPGQPLVSTEDVVAAVGVMCVSVPQPPALLLVAAECESQQVSLPLLSLDTFLLLPVLEGRLLLDPLVLLLAGILPVLQRTRILPESL